MPPEPQGEGGNTDRVAFVGGATGATGREVVRRLAQGHHRVVAHLRPDSVRLDAWRRAFTELGAQVDTTPWQEEEIRRALERARPQVVFALLGTTRARQRADAQSTYERVDYGMTMMLLEAARQLDPKPRFIYLSAAGAGPSGRGSYMEVRHRCEEAVRASGLTAVIARPSFILADRDEPRPGERLGAAISDGVLRVAGFFGAKTLEKRFSSMSSHALAQALVHFAETPLEEGTCTVVEAEVLRSLGAS